MQRAGRMPPSRPSIRCMTRKFSSIVSTRAAALSSRVEPSQCRPRASRSRADRSAVKLALTNDSRTSGARARNQPSAQKPHPDEVARVVGGAVQGVEGAAGAQHRPGGAVQQADRADDRGRLGGAAQLVRVDPRPAHETRERRRDGLGHVGGQLFGAQRRRQAVRQREGGEEREEQVVGGAGGEQRGPRLSEPVAGSHAQADTGADRHPCATGGTGPAAAGPWPAGRSGRPGSGAVRTRSPRCDRYCAAVAARTR